MFNRRGHHPSFAGKRGLLGVGGAAASLDAAVVSAAPAGSSVLGGIGDDITSLFDAGTSVLATSTTSPSLTSSSPTSSHSTSSPPTSTTSHLTTSQSSPPPQTTPSPTATSSTSTDYSVYSVTSGSSVVYLTTTMALPSATSAAPSSFLQNPALEGGVFTLVGIVALVILFIVVTCTLRKRRRRHTDAITFDPGMPEFFGDRGAGTTSLEKRRLSGGSSAYVHGLPYAAPQQMQMMGPPLQGSYQMHAHANQLAFRDLPPNPPYPPRSPPNPPASVAQESDFNCSPTGGANLTRKYSDRKPVPPLLPSPVHDPSRRLTLPQQFCAGSLNQPVSPVAPSGQGSITLSDPVAKPGEQPYAGI